MRHLRELSARLELERAENSEPAQLSAAITEAEMRRMYIEWGLKQVENLSVDGVPVSVDTLLSAGPEALCAEVADRVRDQCFLSEQQRKN